MSKALALLTIIICGSCSIRVYINSDDYAVNGFNDQQKGRYPPFEQAIHHQAEDTLVLAYEATAADFKRPSSTGRYQWIIPHVNTCVIYPRSLSAWKGFIDSLQAAGVVDLRLVVTNYNRPLLLDFHEWLEEQAWSQALYVLSNQAYGHKRSRKKARFLEELAGPQADTRFASVTHLLIDPNGNCVYIGREDEDPKNAGAKPRSQIEAQIRQKLAQK